MRPHPEPDRPPVTDPANRTRLAWTRTALAFAAIGAAMLKNSPVEGTAVLFLGLPVWAVSRRAGSNRAASSSIAELRLVTATVVLIAVAALIIALTGHPPASLTKLLHV